MIPFSFIGCENENQTSLSAPSTIKIEDGVIIFDNVKDAEYYTLMSNDEVYVIDYKHSPYVQIIDNKIHYNANKYFELGKSYSIQIKSQAEGKVDSNYSNIVSYKHLSSLTKPTNATINSTMLTWDYIDGVTSYLVKVITPFDTEIYDMEGNIIIGDDPESIENADITTYTCNRNRFDFSTILNKAGNYSFYIKAISNLDNEYRESGYTTKQTYTHTKYLEAPSIKSIMNKDGNLYMSLVIDNNSNALEIKCGDFIREVELNNTDPSIVQNGNLINVNLTEFFQDVIFDGKHLDLTQLTQYVFTAQSKYFTASEATSKFYLDSGYSNEYIHNNTARLDAPILKPVQYNAVTKKYLAEWTVEDDNNISAYKVYIMKNGTLDYVVLDKYSNSILLEQDFNSIVVQSLGVGSFVSSKLSNVIVNSSISNSLRNINVEFADNVLAWDYVEDAEVLIECGNQQIQVYGTELDLNQYIDASDPIIKFYMFKEGYNPYINELSIDKLQKLATPIIGAGQGFVSSNKYLLTFSGVKDAIGYYVYVGIKGEDNFVKVDELFTTTEIDLTSVFSNQDQSKTYEVKIQAVADTYGLYQNSDLSRNITLNSTVQLDAPKLYRNNNGGPIVRVNEGGTTQYWLYFYGVKNAQYYEILINYNKITKYPTTANDTGLIKENVTNLVVGLDSYEIKVRAMPDASNNRIMPSAYSTATSTIRRQLEKVTNIKVDELNGVYTLSFTAPENSSAWEVRIVKLHDAEYESKLNELGLSSTFTVYGSVDIAKYIQDKGEYEIYMSALAPDKENYIRSEEAKYEDSSTGKSSISKLDTLSTPSEIEFVSESQTSFLVSWQGDQHADYYTINLTQPNGVVVELKAYDNLIDINDYINMQGMFNVEIFAKVNSSGDNAMSYESSASAKASYFHNYNEIHDFNRKKNNMFDSQFDNYIEDVQELKNTLWYHYLYGVDYGLNNDTRLAIYIHQGQDENGDDEDLRTAIIRLANEAGSVGIDLYNFNQDEQWIALINEPSTADSILVQYIAGKLIALYPDIHYCSNIDVSHTDGSNIFKLSYKNLLNTEKQTTDSELVKKGLVEDYGNKYEYLTESSRRSSGTNFNINKRTKYSYVTTTEQLLQAVQDGYRPIFIGDSAIAEEVYNNAKAVLLAIVNDRMTDVEKVTNIFDWLEYGFGLNENETKKYNNGVLTNASINEYGIRKEYYLEGIFLNINDQTAVNYDGTFNLNSRYATSYSYSKAFALMCAIEGIECVVVNGEYSYTVGPTTYTVPHQWNKVKLSTSSNGEENWYVVDLTFSDNKIKRSGAGYDSSNIYGISSHTYFLVTDEFMLESERSDNLRFVDKNNLKSKSYQDNRACSQNYDYYANSSFKLTTSELAEISNNLRINDEPARGFEYSKVYSNSTNYQEYDNTDSYGKLQNYLLNSLLYTVRMAKNNNGHAVFEFKYNGMQMNYGRLDEVNADASIYYYGNVILKDKLDIIELEDGKIYIYRIDQTSGN